MSKKEAKFHAGQKVGGALPRLLRTADAARYCGFAKSSFEKFRCYGGGSRFIRRGRSVFYDLCQRRSKSTALAGVNMHHLV